MSEKTSDYNEVVHNSRPFLWGIFLKNYEVGPYKIIEYRPSIINQRGAMKFRAYVNVSMFHLYIDNDGLPFDTRQAFDTLEAALAAGIAYMVEGPSHKSDEQFINKLKKHSQPNSKKSYYKHTSFNGRIEENARKQTTRI